MTTSLLKVGGAHLDDPRFLDGLLSRVRELTEHGSVVVVHGGGKQIGALQRRLGLDQRKVDGLRATSRDDMAVVSMVLCGLVNKRIVAHFNHNGLNTLGVCGADGALLRAPFYGTGELGRVGDAPQVDEIVLEDLLELHDVVVLAPVCQAPDGGLLNVNADTVAQAVAVALGVEEFEFVTDVDAVHTEDGPAPTLNSDDVQRLITLEIVDGGMLPKMEAALAALDGGVPRVRVGSLESLTDGGGTEVVA